MDSQPKILAVDDVPANLTLLERVLKQVDAEVLKATSAAEALALTDKYDFCVAIVDVQMPDMDGYELVSRMRSSPKTRTLPAIFVSAIYADEYHFGKGYEAGAVDFISKPFNPDFLVSKVKVFLELYNQRRALEKVVEQLAEANKAIKEFNESLENQVKLRTQELQTAYKTLEKIDKTKTNFITIAAHELRTPLTLIKGYAEMLEDLVVKAVPDSQPLLQGILTGESRMLEVVNSLLDLTKIDSETIRLQKRSILLKIIMDGVVANLAEPVKERKQHLAVQGFESLPLLDGDPDLLYKVFYQLVVNAIKFTPDAGDIIVSALLIETNESQQPPKKYIQISVRDTGIGIAPEDQELIFEKFFQTGSAQFHSSGKTKFKGGGPGLGLTIARGIITMHGGRIWAESPGYDETAFPGSTFYVLLPVKSEQAG